MKLKIVKVKMILKIYRDIKSSIISRAKKIYRKVLPFYNGFYKMSVDEKTVKLLNVLRYFKEILNS